jgi:ABC-type multidrug transport system ATPase subunit
MARPASSSNEPRLEDRSIEFTDLSFSTYTHKHVRCLSWKRVLRRQVLSELYGVFRAGTITTILGPSGCGKTTLMTALAGRALIGKYFSYTLGVKVSIGGSIINPVEHRAEFGFVHAHETLFPTDTPVESFEFVLKLRGIDGQGRLDEIVRLLRLTSCKDTFIGSATLKGLSSGEQKRVSVGLELISDCKYIFLDEPTSGLDSSTAYEVMDLIRQYTARTNACIVCVLHQPSNKILDLIDDIVFMTKDGRVCYWGSPAHLADYFSVQGYHCPSEYSPADYVMFLLQTLEDTAIDQLVRVFEPSMERIKDYIDSQRRVTRAEDCLVFQERPYNIQKWFRELRMLVAREYRSTVRDLSVVVLRIALAFIFGTLIAFLFFQVGQTETGTINSSHIGLVATLGIFALVSSAQSLVVAYAIERPIMLREYASGLYSVGAYSLSKDVLEYPVVVVLVLIYLTLGYLIGGLQGSYLLLLLGMILLGLASAATSFLFAAASSSVDMGALCATYVLVLETLLSGFFVRVDQIPQVIRWIQWINPLRYGLSIMFIAEFNDLPGHEELFATDAIQSDMILFYIFMLVGLIIIFRLAGILVLWLRTRKSVV